MRNTKYILIIALSVLTLGCTDLEVEEIDSIVVTGGVNIDENLVESYNQFGAIMSSQDNTYAMMEVSGDAQLIPTRGTDWGDGGIWRQMHQHTWTAEHPFIFNSWNGINRLTFFANQILVSEPSPQQEAEARYIRALASFLILDLWGFVPDRNPNDPVTTDPAILSREAAVARIEEDLDLVHFEALPSTGSASGESKLVASKAAFRMLSAKFYLNKHILLNGAETNSEPAAADLQRVIADVDAITAEGFSLQEDYFGIFGDPAESTESIFLIQGDAGTEPRIRNTLHYNHNFVIDGGGWNGFATTSDFYSLFEGPEDTNAPESGQELRRGYVPTDGDSVTIFGRGMLVGQQYGVEIEENGSLTNNVIPLTTRGGSPLVFTEQMPEELTGHGEATGIRLIKYAPDAEKSVPGTQIFFRYADALLMKSEAQHRAGNSGAALTLINELRDIREASPLASLSDQDILDERGRELYIEFWRRQDLIRFGKFLDPWLYKDQSDPTRLLYPVPTNALSTNPNLEQNPGY